MIGPLRTHEVCLRQRIPINTGHGKTAETQFNHAADADHSRSNDSDRHYLLGDHHGNGTEATTTAPPTDHGYRRISLLPPATQTLCRFLSPPHS